MKNKDRKLARRLEYLMSQSKMPFSAAPFIDPAKRGDYIAGVRSDAMRMSEWKHAPLQVKDRLEMFEIASALGISDEDMFKMWAGAWRDSEDYGMMPRPPRQDNKTHLNKQSTYSSNVNKIRYPKKCRKTAWKRFYRLFPFLKPNRYVITKYEKFRLESRGCDTYTFDVKENKCENLAVNDIVVIGGVDFKVAEIEWFEKAFSQKGDNVAIIVKQK